MSSYSGTRSIRYLVNSYACRTFDRNLRGPSGPRTAVSTDSVAGHFLAVGDDRRLVEVGRHVGVLLEEGALGDLPVREQVLVVADSGIVETLGMRRQRVCQPNLVDHPDVKSDVHAEHSQVGEKDGVRPGYGLPRRRPLRRWRRWDRGHDVPLVVVAGRQQKGPVGSVVECDEDRPHPGVVEVVGGGQRMRVAGGLRIEPALVDDAGVGDLGAVGA